MRSGTGVGEGELGEDPDPTAELLRQLVVVEALWNAEYTAAQGRLSLRAPRCGGDLGLRRHCGDGRRAQGSRAF